jgi:hypothetical protein
LCKVVVAIGNMITLNRFVCIMYSQKLSGVDAAPAASCFRLIHVNVWR